MGLAATVVLALSLVTVAAAAPGIFRDRQRLVVLALLLVAAVALWTRSHRWAAPPSHAARVAWAKAHHNRYEALYEAKIWSADDSRGGVELARQAKGLGLFRTCLDASGPLRAAADSEISRSAQELFQECTAERQLHR